ncbi:MAG: hypothetical protein Q8O67_25580 [Deltaproteobacteria bacterium]|nr:hypothetical protein [Deltaproteobacteria bacterium]
MILAHLFTLLVMTSPAASGLEEIDRHQTLQDQAAQAGVEHEEKQRNAQIDVTWKVATASTVATLACAALAFVPFDSYFAVAVVFGVVPPVFSSLVAGAVASFVNPTPGLGLKVGLGGVAGGVAAGLLVFLPAFAIGTAWDAPYRGTDISSGWATDLPIVTVPGAAVIGAIAGATIAGFVTVGAQSE